MIKYNNNNIYTKMSNILEQCIESMREEKMH